MSRSLCISIWCVLIGMLGVSFWLSPVRENLSANIPMKAAIQALPQEIGNWTGKDMAVSERVYEILETRNVLLREYQSDKGDTVYLNMVLSYGNGRATHPPEVCYLGEGIEVIAKGRARVALGPNQTELPVNKLVIQDGKRREVVVYWYHAGQATAVSYWWQQIRLMWAKVKGQDVAVALVRLSTLLGPEGESSAIERIERFGQQFMPLMKEAI